MLFSGMVLFGIFAYSVHIVINLCIEPHLPIVLLLRLVA